MGEIQPGDWVTINGHGPYLVLSDDGLGGGKGRLYIQRSEGLCDWVEADWCEKVPSPSHGRADR